jgi:hypothetical protein
MTFITSPESEVWIYIPRVVSSALDVGDWLALRHCPLKDISLPLLEEI